MLEINIEEFLRENWLGFAYSFSFLFGILITAFILKQLDKFPSEVIRKFIHISVSNWWFILVNHFHGLYASLLVFESFLSFEIGDFFIEEKVKELLKGNSCHIEKCFLLLSKC